MKIYMVCNQRGVTCYFASTKYADAEQWVKNIGFVNTGSNRFQGYWNSVYIDEYDTESQLWHIYRLIRSRRMTWA